MPPGRGSADLLPFTALQDTLALRTFRILEVVLATPVS